MTPPSQYAPLPAQPLPPSSPFPTHSHSSRHTILDARPPHDDFLGTSSQDSNNLHDTLGELSFTDGYFNLSGEEGLSSDLSSDQTNTHQNVYSSSWPSTSYPPDSLLFASPSSYAPDMGHASPSPTLATLHDSYYPQNPGSTYNTPSVTRMVPSIHVQTEMLPTSPPYEQHSPYDRSPQGRSPSLMFPSSYPHSSPSSIGSAPPVTPQTPYASVSPHSPYISQLSTSPISPSFMATHSPAFDPKESLVTITPEVGNVLDIANVAGHPHGGLFVPQKTYRPHTISDRRRYVDEVQLEPPIMFFSHNPTGCGIPLKDAISSRFSALEGRDDAMFQGRGPSVSIRLNWPGYAPWSRQIPTRDFRSPPQPITRAKLARNVAKTVQRFIQEMENQTMEDPAEVKWRVGGRGIRLEDLILVGLQHVSMGSWQAHVRLVRRPH